MDLWTIIKVVVRRWYAVLPVLMLTAAFALVVQKAPPTYEANGSALLVAPNSATGATGQPVKQNSFLIFSGSLNITASAVSRVMNDTATREAYFKAGLLHDYEIGADPSIPLIGVTATGSDPEVVVATVKRALADVSDHLKSLQDQAEAPADLRIGVRELVNPTRADSLRGNVGRTMATVAALGLLLAVAVALTLEGILTRRPGHGIVRGVPPVRAAVGPFTSPVAAPPALAPAPAAPVPVPTVYLRPPAPPAVPAAETPAAAPVHQSPAAEPVHVQPEHVRPATAVEQPAAATATATPDVAASAPEHQAAAATPTGRASSPGNPRAVSGPPDIGQTRVPRQWSAMAEQADLDIHDENEDENEPLPAPLPFRRTDERGGQGRPLTSIDGGADTTAGRRVHPFVAAQRRAQSEQEG